MIVKFLAAAVAAATPVASLAAQFITQDSFQAGAASLTAFETTTNTRVASGADYVNFAFGNGSPTAKSNLFVSFGAGNIPGVATLAQTVATTPGKRYALSFDYGAFGGSQSFELLIGGQSIMAYTPTGTANLDTLFTGTSQDFLAVGASTEILFRVLSELDDNSDVLIDNVAVSAVPETASWALMIAGFGLVGLAGRRHRQNLVNA